MITVVLFTRDNCALCDAARLDLEALQEQHPHELAEVDVEKSPELERAYGEHVPVVEAGPFRLQAPFTRQELAVTLGAARDRAGQLQALQDERYQKARARGSEISTADRASYWFSRRYLLVMNLLVLIYVGLPFLAPVLMANGATGPARMIYRAYGAVCHQLAFRSWFLFGDQPVYPRGAAGMEGLETFGEVTALDEEDLLAARNFIGNEALGYKVAFCERDVAIYAGILLFGLLYGLARKRIPALPWYLWIIIGIGPIALDGLSQLLSQPPFSLWNYRESTPLLRTLTGGVFGFTTAWFGYPQIEISMQDTRRVLATKFARLSD